jgi:hypothetical protein
MGAADINSSHPPVMEDKRDKTSPRTKRIHNVFGNQSGPKSIHLRLPSTGRGALKAAGSTGGLP